MAPQYSNPGRGWIHVRATEPTETALVAAIEAGEFYASTGVELTDVVRDGSTLRVALKPRENVKYTVEFIGAGGKQLDESFEESAAYTLKPGDKYVRARVRDSNGLMAWTQPLFAK
jgi:hypothetical protein